jgi:hypothetical protein
MKSLTSLCYQISLKSCYVYKKKVLTDKFNMKRLDVVDVILKIKFFKIYDRFVLS